MRVAPVEPARPDRCARTALTVRSANRISFVVAHAAWQHCGFWDEVAEQIVNAGHSFYCPTLPVYDNVGRPKGGIGCCADALSSLIRGLRDERVVLVGHSFGGVVVAKVAEQVPSRVQRILFLSAFVPLHQGSLMEDMPREYGDIFEELARQSGTGHVMLPYRTWRDAFVNDAGDELATSSYKRLKPFPISVFKERIDLPAFHALAVPKTYLRCTQDIALPPGEWGWFPRMSNRLGACTVIDMPGGHVTPITRPALLADTLIQAAPA